ncbi:MAG TPA: capsule assembly Wzi family protein [Longimicrobiales bacterium]|nr:capsule assembly Wzi family protein [Longimicrobiales bacterium]
MPTAGVAQTSQRRAAPPDGAAAMDSAAVPSPPAFPRRPPSWASPFVPPDHWSRRAARRLQTLGLAPPGYEAGLALLTRREVAYVLDYAAARATLDRPSVAAVARGYAERFAEELGGRVPADTSALGRLRRGAGWIGAGYDHADGRVLAGVGYDNGTDWTGTRPVPDSVAGILATSLSAGLGRYLALRAVPTLRETAVGLPEVEAVATWRALGAWVGRRRVAFGPARGGGIVLSGGVPLNGFGVFLADPIRFPWIFRHMGPIRIETFASQVRGGDRIRDPYFVAFRGTMTPHPRFTAGLNRAAMFGGEGNDPLTLRNLSFLLVGGTRSGQQGEFANDVLSADFQFRPPLGPVPLQLYLEWGMDDSSGAWLDVPGMTAGAELGALPGAPWLSLGGEWTFFHRSCCGNTIWYRNWAMRQGWTDDGWLLGHPLGGEGTQWLAYGAAEAAGARLRLEWSAFLRRRQEENLLAPERLGRSRGGSLAGALRIDRALELEAVGGLERGAAGWHSSSLTLGIRALF